jgi:hypothetical protein
MTYAMTIRSNPRPYGSADPERCTVNGIPSNFSTPPGSGLERHEHQSFRIALESSYMNLPGGAYPYPYPCRNRVLPSRTPDNRAGVLPSRATEMEGTRQRIRAHPQSGWGQVVDSITGWGSKFHASKHAARGMITQGGQYEGCNGDRRAPTAGEPGSARPEIHPLP